MSEHRLEEQLLGASMFLAAGSVSGTAACVGRHTLTVKAAQRFQSWHRFSSTLLSDNQDWAYPIATLPLEECDHNLSSSRTQPCSAQFIKNTYQLQTFCNDFALYRHISGVSQNQGALTWCQCPTWTDLALSSPKQACYDSEFFCRLQAGVTWCISQGSLEK